MNYVCKTGCCVVSVIHAFRRGAFDTVTMNKITGTYDEHAKRLKRHATTLRHRVTKHLCLNVAKIEREQRKSRRAPLGTNRLANRFLSLPRVTA